MQKTYKIEIYGRVQGVGFRPHVFLLAKKMKLNGTVSNNEQGVIIYLSGPETKLKSFYDSLVCNPSKSSRIIGHDYEEIPYLPFDEFNIIPSEKGSKLNLQLTPDFAICESCKQEIEDQENRRYRYPFTTCVHCGPRWAITESFPFERENTSISSFQMCRNCLEEYTNPADRRFHSQTNSCEVCGIQYSLVDEQGEIVPVPKEEIFKTMGELLHKGKIMAIKNTGGYLLCCDATSKESVQRLRRRKHRPEKPFALMYPSMELLKRHLTPSKEEEVLLRSSEGPIVIIPIGDYGGDVALEAVAPGLKQLGVMLPYSGVMQLLANEIDRPIVATSGNIHGSPILSDRTECELHLKSVADYFFHHNLKVLNPQDDSVVKISPKFGRQLIFRRARGYAPNLCKRKDTGSEKILAMGGNLKSAIAFIPNDYMYQSEYLGVLDHPDVYKRFTDTVSKFMDVFEQQPDTILIDAHPGYESSLYGLELAARLGIKTLSIQHHKAHFAAVLGEYDLFDNPKPVLGVVWDGTGYGEDKAIWGGEFFTYENNLMERHAHFEYYPWLAGDKMAKEPRLSLLSLIPLEYISEIDYKFTDQELLVYKTLKDQNRLKTSSVGRLFDAVASILDIANFNTYEGEAAILMESCVDEYDLDACRSYGKVSEDGSIPTPTILKNLYEDYKNGASREMVITNFLFTLATLVKQLAVSGKFSDIAFSGGVFQNAILVDMIIDIFDGEYNLYFHQDLSPNDENISYGQLMYYLNCNSDKKIR